MIWGGLHGFYLVFALVTAKGRSRFNEFAVFTKSPRLLQLIQTLTTFILCAFAWIFFRANSVSDAFLAIKKIFLNQGGIFGGNNPALLPYCAIGIMILAIVDYKTEFLPGRLTLFTNKNILVRYMSYIFLIITILLIGVFDSGQFIYFQF